MVAVLDDVYRYLPEPVRENYQCHCRILRCILGMLTDMSADFRYLPFVVLPPLPQEQFVQLQLLPHLQPQSPWLPMEHKKEHNCTCIPRFME